MWKFLLIVFSARVSCGPLQNGQNELLNPAANWFNPFVTTSGTCRCPPSTKTSDQIESSVGVNQPMPFGVSNVGTYFYQNFLVNGAVPSEGSRAPAKVVVRDDYTYTPGIGAHKYHKKAVIWNDARKSCNDEGGHLAIINSVAEAQLLGNILNNSQPVAGATWSYTTHMGFHGLYKHGEWVTIFGESLANTGYETWSVGQPNFNFQQHCGCFFRSAGLCICGCTDLLPYFCEQKTV